MGAWVKVDGASLPGLFSQCAELEHLWWEGQYNDDPRNELGHLRLVLPNLLSLQLEFDTFSRCPVFGAPSLEQIVFLDDSSSDFPSPGLLVDFSTFPPLKRFTCAAGLLTEYPVDSLLVNHPSLEEFCVRRCAPGDSIVKYALDAIVSHRSQAKSSTDPGSDAGAEAKASHLELILSMSRPTDEDNLGHLINSIKEPFLARPNLHIHLTNLWILPNIPADLRSHARFTVSTESRSNMWPSAWRLWCALCEWPTLTRVREISVDM